MSERTRHAAELAARLTVVWEHQNGRGLDLATLGAAGVGVHVDKLLRLEASLRHLAERECSDPTADFSEGAGGSRGEHGQNEWGREAKRRDRLEKAAVAVLAFYGLQCDFNRDPRGSAIYIHFPDGAYNTMGGRETGWGV